MYRYFNSQFWTDPFIEKLSPEQKLIYIYLFTACPTQAGIHEISVRRISNETGVAREDVLKALKMLEQNKKIYRIGDYILLVNFLKYQATRSPKVIKKIEKELSEIQYKTKIIKIFKEKIWSIHMEIKGINFPLDITSLKHFENENEQEDESFVANVTEVSESEKQKQTEAEDSLTSSSSFASCPTLNCPTQRIVDLWNSYIERNASELKPVKKVSSGTKRHRHLCARWRENPSLTDWERVFNNATQSDFLNGRVTGSRGKPFFASFDWIIQSADNFNKVWEGQYNNRKPLLDKEKEIELKVGKTGYHNLSVIAYAMGQDIPTDVTQVTQLSTTPGN